MYNQTLISSAQSKLLSKPLSNIKVKVSEILLTFKLPQLITIFEIISTITFIPLDIFGGRVAITTPFVVRR